MEAEPSTQSPIQKLNFGNSSQKLHKHRYKNLLIPRHYFINFGRYCRLLGGGHHRNI